MHPRAAATVLDRIADLLELRGESPFRARAYRNAARAVSGLSGDDLAAPLRDGALSGTPGIGPASLGVLRELVETGESSYLEQLGEDTPEGLVEMLRIPGLGTSRIHAIHEGLDIDTMHELEAAARDGRLARLPRFGPRTAERVLRGIAYLREVSAYVLLPQARAEAQRLTALVAAHPGVARVALGGSVRRSCEVSRDVDLVAACRGAPAEVASAIARAADVRDAIGVGSASVAIRFVDGTRLDLYCVPPDRFAIALWRATGSAAHVDAVRVRARERGLLLEDDVLRTTAGDPVAVPDERALYGAVGLPFIEPELREGLGEVEAAAAGTLPALVTSADIRGVLHCHSQYSDGTATIADMAAAARARGWRYLGISDHSQSAAYAGGLTREAVVAQHAEIDRVNAATPGFRVLKGIEADILADGRIDYDPELLDRFDYVIASVHSRFAMDERAMTARVLRALDDPHVTVLGHPTGRLLLTREPYAIDMDAVLAHAAERGVAVELNADPHRLDLDWRLLRSARRLGCAVEIGPDAHAPSGLDNTAIGVAVARKGWLEPADVLNTLDAEQVLDRARARRTAAGARA